MEKRKVNGQYHDPLDFINDFDSRIESSPSPPPQLFPLSTPPPPQPPSMSPCSSGGVGTLGGGCGYIEHSVSKLDNLAGLAIKYGVEVADIRKLNGLVTDHQMFARKTLLIPLSIRHSLSSIGSDAPDNNCFDKTLPRRTKSDIVESFKLGSSPMRNVSPAMSTRQGYYAHEPAVEKSHSEGLEMAAYLKGGAQDGPFTDVVTNPNAPLSQHRKCKSVAYDLYAQCVLANNEEAKENNPDKLIENISWLSTSKVEPSSKAPETLLKEEPSNGGRFSALGSSKGLALRPKSTARIVSGGKNEGGFPTALSDSAGANVSSGVRKSCSTTSLHDGGNGTSSSWLTDLQVLSTAAITKPIFDGLAKPKPKTGKKSKAALD
ncbi:hypothetical protein LIER_00566 [Lithospermum erythrorhizon]|uniref:LysM domain-containing protein n=1 Tax=Lithospermum erythrorhizon TaxID=34254 RepID=A0AAV3NHW3_LITER